MSRFILAHTVIQYFFVICLMSSHLFLSLFLWDLLITVLLWMYATCWTYLIQYNIRWKSTSRSSSLYYVLHFHVTSSFFGSSIICSQTSSVSFSCKAETNYTHERGIVTVLCIFVLEFLIRRENKMFCSMMEGMSRIVTRFDLVSVSERTVLDTGPSF